MQFSGLGAERVKRQDPPPPPPDTPQPDPNNPQGQPPLDPNKPFAPPFNPGPPIVPADYTYSLNAGNGMISIIFVLFFAFLWNYWAKWPWDPQEPFFKLISSYTWIQWDAPLQIQCGNLQFGSCSFFGIRQKALNWKWPPQNEAAVALAFVTVKLPHWVTQTVKVCARWHRVCLLIASREVRTRTRDSPRCFVNSTSATALWLCN